MYTKEQKLPTMLMFSIIIQFSKMFVSRKDEIAKIFQSNSIISVWYKKTVFSIWKEKQSSFSAQLNFSGPEFIFAKFWEFLKKQSGI
jgi:hypothetical protein